jgi:hypothetical protein
MRQFLYYLSGKKQSPTGDAVLILRRKKLFRKKKNQIKQTYEEFLNIQ